ncbi:unnamed protein product [Chironomus riparius]|uniref:glutathione transferase n=1 Tax=Chironomus riparius TaxID=315576 RepID=A0A9N9RG10_9DIPT|nr:unnamed protein product [Chironomus riparius]
MCRLVHLHEVGMDVEIIPVDFLKLEQKSPEYMKINPMGQVPVLDNDGFILTESRAIMAYLVNSKKPGSTLYPSNPKQRAIVDTKLYFNASNLFSLIFASSVHCSEPTLTDISGEIGNWPKLEAWYKRCASIPGYEENLNGAKMVGPLLKQLGVKLAPLK